MDVYEQQQIKTSWEIEKKLFKMYWDEFICDYSCDLHIQDQKTANDLRKNKRRIKFCLPC